MKAKLHIQVFLRNGIPHLKKCYATPPFKLANITEDKQSKQLQLMIMCSSPGILDNDVYEVKVEVDAACSLRLHTQSYQRLFRMQAGATQSMEVLLNERASLVYLPNPAVPHEQSIFTSVNKIYLAKKSNLIWGEILTCGRQLKEEVFTFSKYHSNTEVYLDNRLVIKENLLMQPALCDVQAIGLLEGFTHQASLLCVGDYDDSNQIMNAVHDWLLLQPAIEFGISKTPCKGFVVRVLGCKAEQLYNCLKAVAAMVELVPA